MSTTQRNGIVNPATGLQIFNTTTNCLNIRMSNHWKEICGECDFAPSSPSMTNTLPFFGGTLTLAASTVAGATYSWTGPGGFTSSSQNPSVSNVTTSGTYTLTTTINGCSASRDLAVVVSPYQGVTTSFTYNGAQQSYTMPAGATGIIFDIKGAGGGRSPSNSQCNGGAGGRVQGKRAITAGATIYIYVGGAGVQTSSTGSFNGGSPARNNGNWGWGGGGGGASDIRVGGTSDSNRIAVAGGGGGGSSGWNYGCGTGGDGGGNASGNNGGGGSEPGLAGTQSSPGGSRSGANGGSGSTGGQGWEFSGGGGGGYYGGGGGGWAGGGGGSGYVDSNVTNVTSATGGGSAQTTDGSISITTY
jgi:hypothetical protein